MLSLTMSFIRILYFLCLFILSVFSSTFTQVQITHQDHINMCYNTAKTKYYNIGQEFYDEDIARCAKLKCEAGYEPGTVIVTGISCPKLPTHEKCVTIKGDESLKFPNCCPSIECVHVAET